MNCKVIAIGASTGGVNAISRILSTLPSNLPPILIVQHMPLRFTSIFAHSINNLSEMEAKEAENGDIPQPGQIYIAPSGMHMELNTDNSQLYIHLSDFAKVHHQRPSIDVLFKSIAQSAGKNAIGIILTGMGKDGASGLLEMKRHGAYTIAQDEKTSVVYGMPKEAVNKNAASITAPLDEIPALILSALNTI
jgi:two-component system chemotaxis response regulator CheB